MKRHSLFLGTALVALLAVCAALAGCGNLSALGKGTVLDETAGTNLLTITVLDKDGKPMGGGGSGSARTILPDAFAQTDLTFYLFGTAPGTEPYGPEAITLSPTDGTAELSLDAKQWTLTLAAYDSNFTGTPTSAILNEAVLVGYASVDLQRFPNKATFTLTTNGITKPGDAQVKIVLSGWSTGTIANYKVTASLRSLKDHAAQSVKMDKVAITNTTTATDKVEWTAGTFVDTTTGNMLYLSEVAPGSYQLELTFTNKDDTTETWVRTETIQIAPGKTLEDTYTEWTIPAIVGVVPEAPTALKVSYLADTQEVPNAGYYDVKLDWTRTGYNEREFVLQIVDISGVKDTTPAQIKTPTEDDEWIAGIPTASDENTFSTTNSDKTTDIQNAFINGTDHHSAGFVSGGLFNGSTSVTVRLALGKIYAVRIKAKNYAGESAWLYPAVPSSKITHDGTNGQFNEYINRFKIEYNLNGGEIESGEETGFKKLVYYSFGDTVKYHEFEDNDHVKKGSISFKQWKNGTTEYTPDTAYTEFTNLSLIANYPTGATTYILDPNDYELSDVKYDYKASGTDTAVPADNKLVIEEATKGTNEDLVFKVRATDFEYTYVSLSIPGTFSTTVYNSVKTTEGTAPDTHDIYTYTLTIPAGIITVDGSVPYPIIISAHVTQSYSRTIELTLHN